MYENIKKYENIKNKITKGSKIFNEGVWNLIGIQNLIIIYECKELITK